MAAGAVTVARLATLMEMDLAAWRGGLKTAKTEGDAAAKSIGASFKDAFRKSATGENFVDFRGLLAQARAQRTPLREVFAGVALDAGRDLRTAITTGLRTAATNGANFLKSSLGGVGSALRSVLQGIFQGIGIGIFQSAMRGLSDLINLIPNLIGRGREYLIVVDQIADATGATAEASSRLAGTLQYLGAPVGSIVSLLGQMSRNLEENEARLNAIGVQTRDTSGALLNQVQILENARQAFARYGDGTAKANIIAREFGRGGLAVLVDYLKLTDEQANAITQDLQAQGLIVSESQRQMAETAQREGQRFQNALTGLGATLFTVIGPQITAFFSNLSDTITAHATEISNAIASAVSFILGMVSALTGASGTLDSFSSSIQSGNAAVSPYSAQLLQLNLELADLDGKQKAATGSADGQRQAIQRQIDVVERQIRVLDRQDKIQDGVFRRAIAGLARVYQARLDNLDLAERERANLERQRDLNDQLNDAQLALAEAQRGTPGFAGPVVDAEAVASAMERVTEIQRQQAENARQLEVDQQRKSLEATRDYIEEIGALLENADDKRAALNNLRTRQGVLEARRAAQLAAGDEEGAADTAARLEAIKTAELRAEEEIRQGVRRSSLERRKELLSQEKAAVKAAVVDETAIRRAEIQKQIAHLQALQDKWDAMTGKQKDDIAVLSTSISGKGGLTDALDDAREAGVKFGEDVKDALKGLGDAFAGLLDLLHEIGNNEVFKLLNSKPEEAVKRIADSFVQGDIDYFRTLPPTAPFEVDTFGSYGGILKQGMTNEEAVAALVKAGLGRDQGGWIGKGLFANAGPREYVLDNALSEKLNRFFSMPQMPTLAPAMAGGFGGADHGHDIYLNGEKVGEAVTPGIERHLADRRRF